MHVAYTNSHVPASYTPEGCIKARSFLCLDRGTGGRWLIGGQFLLAFCYFWILKHVNVWPWKNTVKKQNKIKLNLGRRQLNSSPPPSLSPFFFLSFSSSLLRDAISPVLSSPWRPFFGLIHSFILFFFWQCWGWTLGSWHDRQALYHSATAQTFSFLIANFKLNLMYQIIIVHFCMGLIYPHLSPYHFLINISISYLCY